MEKEILLFNSEKECCGCGACYNACPKQAISMVENEYGFVYPFIDKEKCIGCGACKRACGFQNTPEMQFPKKTYALSGKNRDSIMKSASGGVFATLAERFINNGGVVYGATLKLEDTLEPKHICVSDLEQLYKLQGSKYVQSDIGKTYLEIKERLLRDEKVLFSGTPCQVAGLKKFLNKEYDNLLLVDIVCHGVPGRRMFQDFLKYFGKKLNGRITDFKFRDKARGQGYTTRASYYVNGQQKSSIKKGELFSYIFMFSKSLNLRENCYECPFAQEKRVSDITIGDFWGYAKEYGDANPDLNEKYGVSCALCNTEKGLKYIDSNIDDFYILESDFVVAAKYNKQLNGPTNRPADRAMVMEAYKNKGYEYLEKLYWNKYTKYKIKNIISELIPTSLKKRLKK